MNLIQLKYFCAVCIYKSVSEAAAVLHISQPSVSTAVKELEKEFKVSLFSRRYRGMELTKEGEVLLKLSKELILRADEVSHIMKNLGSERKILRLGIPPMVASIFLPKIYQEFLPQNPEVKLEITECGQKELLVKLNDDELDTVLLPHNQKPDLTYVSHKIARLETVCCVSKHNMLSKQKKISPEDLKNSKLIMFKNSFLQTEEISKWFAVKKVVPDIILQTEQLSTVQSLVSGNTGVGFMFRHLAEENTEIVAISTENPIYVDVSLVRKKDAFCFGALEKFERYMKNHKIFLE